jgi:type VI secretion system secreted protein VgrG
MEVRNYKNLLGGLLSRMQVIVRVSQEFNKGPHCSFDQEVLLVNVDDTPAVGVAFEILRDDGNMAGKSAENGSTQLQKSTGMESYVIRYKGERP